MNSGKHRYIHVKAQSDQTNSDRSDYVDPQS